MTLKGEGGRVEEDALRGEDDALEAPHAQCEPLVGSRVRGSGFRVQGLGLKV